MLTPDLVAFVRSSLPPAPCQVLEIGAGRGELAAELRAAGYAVTAIDPSAEAETGVERLSLIAVAGAFDAAVAVVSLHHIEPLEASFEHLAALLPAGARLVVDEIDVDRCDERAIEWWLAQRRSLRDSDPPMNGEPAEILATLRAHIHPLEAVRAALRPHFDLALPVPGPYLHRWELHPSLREVEVELIAGGRLPAVGARFVAARRG